MAKKKASVAANDAVKKAAQSGKPVPVPPMAQTGQGPTTKPAAIKLPNLKAVPQKVAEKAHGVVKFYKEFYFPDKGPQAAKEARKELRMIEAPKPGLPKIQEQRPRVAPGIHLGGMESELQDLRTELERRERKIVELEHELSKHSKVQKPLIKKTYGLKVVDA